MQKSQKCSRLQAQTIQIDLLGFYSRPICTNDVRLGGVYIECYRPNMVEIYIFRDILPRRKGAAKIF